MLLHVFVPLLGFLHTDENTHICKLYVDVLYIREFVQNYH